MDIIRKRTIDISEYLTITIFISIFIIPIDFLRELGIHLDQYLFAIMMLIYYSNYVYKSGKIKVKDIFFLALIIYFSIVYKNISHIHLIGLIVIDKMIDNEEKICKNIYKSKILFVSLFFVFVYTSVYFGEGGRFIFTGIREVNQGGFSLILLFLMIRTKYKKLGNILLVIGIFTFSRSYFLGLIIFLFSNYMVKKRILVRGGITKVLKNFKLVTVLSIIILILLSNYFINLYNTGNLSNYAQGMSKLTSITDYSNYFRMTINTNLIEIYKSEPQRLLFGIGSEEFLYLNRKITEVKGIPYRAIKPHNYFFSYFRIYGVFSLLIFWYLSTVFKRIIHSSNLPIFLVVFSYMTFLGVGASSYWIYLTIFTMFLYKSNLREREI